MKIVIQKVKKASVEVDGGVVGEIEKGLMLLLGVSNEDTEEQIECLVDKTINLRLFGERFDKSVMEVEGKVLLVSQFTLYANCKKGRRPDFNDAAKPEKALELYEKFGEMLEKKGVDVERGEFGAMMEVKLLNDGPVTIILER